MNAIAAFFFFSVMAGMGLVLRVQAARRDDMKSRVRRMYANTRAAIWLRNSIAVVPLWATGAVLFGSLALWPLSLAPFIVVPAMGFLVAAFGLSYRTPAPFLPAWLRTEVEQGLIPVARPSGSDWLTFAIVAALVVVTLILVPLDLIQSRRT